MKATHTLLAFRLLPAVLFASSTAIAQNYDLVINNGRVMDPETLYDAVANVRIKDGRIAAITKERIIGNRSINATGLVVAAGFIDTHLHAQDLFGSKLALRDGTTTGLDLETGAFSVGTWYDNKAKGGGWPLNYGTSSGLNFNRIRIHDPEANMAPGTDWTVAPPVAAAAAKDGVVGWSTQRSTVEQMNQIMRLVDEDLRQGAIGVGVALAYMPVGAASYEIYETQRVAARYGRLMSVHTRFHMQSQTPEEATLALDEVLVNAMLLDAPLLLAHDNDYGWWENEEKLQRARAKGYNVWGEYYPYDIGSTLVSASYLQPDKWEDVQHYKYEETIYDPLTGKWPDKAAFLAPVKKDPGQNIIFKLPYRTPWMKYWLRIPEMTVATDGTTGLGVDGKLLPWDADYSKYAGNPRTAGSYAKVLRMAREEVCR